MLEALRARCLPGGLDLQQPFQVAWYNSAVETMSKLPDLGRSQALGILIGNTRALWPPFLDALRANPILLDKCHPLDHYVETTLLQALHPLRCAWEVRWAHEPPPRMAMQRLAHVSGLAYLSPSHLNVHVTYGPWIALRAAVILDMEGPSEPSQEMTNPCLECESRCLPKFQEAMATGTSDEHHWQHWLAIRDACPVGRSHRYSEEQILYHYTKDREILRRAVPSR